MKRKRRGGEKVLYILVGLSAKNAGPFYGEEIGFRVERALKDLGPEQKFCCNRPLAVLFSFLVLCHVSARPFLFLEVPGHGVRISEGLPLHIAHYFLSFPSLFFPLLIIMENISSEQNHNKFYSRVLLSVEVLKKSCDVTREGVSLHSGVSMGVTYNIAS